MKTFIALASTGILTVPLLTSAATYHYLDLHGMVNSVEAANASAALQLVNATDETIHSGVKLDSGELKDGENYGQEYEYVTTSGDTKTVTAASLDAAMVLATDRAPSSGFMVRP